MASAAKRFFSRDSIFHLLLLATSLEHHSVLSEPAHGEGLGTINALATVYGVPLWTKRRLRGLMPLVVQIRRSERRGATKVGA
jgi:hypothetical protein